MLGRAKRPVEVLRSALAAELGGGANVPFGQRLRFWRRGFKSASAQLFELGRNSPANYVSDLQVARAGGINGAFGRVLKDKLLFEPFFSPHVRVPETVGLIERGRYCALCQDAPDPGPPTDHSGIAALLAACAPDGLVLKPARGNKGRGVLSLDARADGPVVSGQVLEPSALARLVGSLDGYLVTRRVRGAPYAERIFPGAANTLRVITMQDPDTGEVFVPAAMHRFGGTATAPTDNFQTGGLSAGVDLGTGELGRAVRLPSLTGGRLEWLTHHPDTGAAIAGVVVPGWADVKATVVRLAETHRFLKYVGWDVLVTAEGVCVVEGNHNINLGIQVHVPLLKDPRVRRFYRHHQVLG